MFWRLHRAHRRGRRAGGQLGAWLGMVELKPRLAGTIYIIRSTSRWCSASSSYLGGTGASLPGGLKFEHPTTMVLAAVVGHVGQVMARGVPDVKRAALTVAIAIAVSLYSSSGHLPSVQGS